jgi:hypothetical protein
MENVHHISQKVSTPKCMAGPFNFTRRDVQFIMLQHLCACAQVTIPS